MWRGIVLIVVCTLSSLSVFAQTSAFTYQGKLTDGGKPTNGPYQMQFTLLPSAVGGDPLGPTIQIDSVDVANGVFTVELNFTAPSAFNGGARWLQIAVKKPTDNLFSLLTPRQPITSTPYALRTLIANSADNLSSVCTLCVTDAQIQAVDGSKVTGTVPNATNATQLNGSLASFDIGGSGHIAGTLRLEANGLFDPETPSLSLSANGSVKVDAPFLPGGRFTILPNGNVGIGNGAPTEKLDVAGNIKFSGTISGDGSRLSNVSVERTTNLALLGLLRWDLLRPQNFAVGSGPYGVAFDGANIWVANGSSFNVTKLRASDGACAGVVGPPTAACTFEVGSNPAGVAFDGANIWVANNNPGSNTVTKLRASDGACAGVVGPPTAACTFGVGARPFAVAFDGANIWVANQSSNNVTKLRASDGACAGVVGPPTAACTFAVGTNPVTVAFDGANIWVANVNSNNVTKLRASDGACAGVVGPPTAACTFAVGSNPGAVAFDGANIWVTNNGSNVTKLRASDGACAGVVGPPTAACTFAVGSNLAGVAFDGANIWVATTNNLTKLRASDGAVQETFSVGSGPLGVAFDGANIWVLNFNSNNVTKIPAFR